MALVAEWEGTPVLTAEVFAHWLDVTSRGS
jgi:hypothetical protein